MFIVPLIWGIGFFYFHRKEPIHRLEQFIDRHLLPFLIINHSDKKKRRWRGLLLWSVVWIFLILAMAGPRWDFKEIETFSRDQSLLILLDLSESMNATDVKPSRLVRAKQKIEDLINRLNGVKMGLIAFAADPHMIAPLTEDKETIRHLLPFLKTDLVYVQGSRLLPTLDMASKMLEAEPGQNKALLVISDGGFEDDSIGAARRLAEKGVVIHVMGIGTLEGVPLRDKEGNVIKRNGIPVVAKLEKRKLEEMSKEGNGRYLEAHYSDDEDSVIQKELEKKGKEIELSHKSKLWDECFYLFIIPVLPIILLWFRRGAIFAVFLIFFCPTFDLHAIDINTYFKNSEELGKEAFENGDEEKAYECFQDPYRKGVASYKAGNFSEAERLFRQSNRPEVSSSAAYNLGNTLAQQEKFEEAIAAYEEVLKQWPNHEQAKDNLELIRKFLEEQKKQENPSSEDHEEDKDNQENQNDNQNNSKDRQQQNQKDNENKGEGKNQENQQPETKDSENQKSESQEQEQKQEHNDSQQQQNPQESKDESENVPQEDKKDENSENVNNSEKKEEQGEFEEGQDSKQDAKEDKNPKSQEDLDADLWLNRIVNDLEKFLKNKFYIESKKNKTATEINPW